MQTKRINVSERTDISVSKHLLPSWVLVVNFGYVTDLSLWNKVKEVNKSSERALRQ